MKFFEPSVMYYYKDGDYLNSWFVVVDFEFEQYHVSNVSEDSWQGHKRFRKLEEVDSLERLENLIEWCEAVGYKKVGPLYDHDASLQKLTW